jgi:digeranylgeranylglycerophospholipid reductase
VDYDVIVIGGGPAGAYFSNMVSKFGYDVLVLEKDVIGRDKVCAGGITPRCFDNLNNAFGRIPNEIIEKNIDNALFLARKASFNVRLSPLKAFTTNRCIFDKWLIKNSIDNGTTVSENCIVKDIKITSKFASVIYQNGGNQYEKTANLIADCHGANKNKWIESEQAIPEYVVGVQTEIVLPQEYINKQIGNTIEFYFDSIYSKFGYSWVFPRKDSINVGLVDKSPSKNLKETLKRFIYEHPIASKKIDIKNQISKNNLEIRGALIPNRIPKKLFRDRYLLIGDSAGFSDRITWEGISYAIESAKYAAEVFNYAYQIDNFSENVLEEYSKKCEIFTDELNYGNKLQKILYGKELDNVWSDILNYLDKNEEIKNFVINDLNLKNHTSMAKVMRDLPKSKKLRLLRVIGFKNLIGWIV